MVGMRRGVAANVNLALDGAVIEACQQMLRRCLGSLSVRHQNGMPFHHHILEIAALMNIEKDSEWKQSML